MKAAIEKSSWHNEYSYQNKAEKPCDAAVWDAEQERWFIEIETIDDILKLYHRLVISSAAQDDDFDMEIELYDDYRE